MMRKRYINSLFARTPEQVKEEEELYVEAKRIEHDERRWRSARDELVRTVAMPRNDKRKTLGGADLSSSNAATDEQHPPHKRTAKNAAFDAQHYITRPSSSNALKSSSSTIPPFSRATKLAQKITPQRIKDYLHGMGLSDKLAYPTATNVAKYDGVKDATAQLLEIRRAHEKVAADLRAAKGLSNGTPGPADSQTAATATPASDRNTPTSTPATPVTPAPDNRMNMSTDSVEGNDPNKRRKL